MCGTSAPTRRLRSPAAAAAGSRREHGSERWRLRRRRAAVQPSPQQRRWGSAQPPQGLPGASGMGSARRNASAAAAEGGQVGKRRRRLPLATNGPCAGADLLLSSGLLQPPGRARTCHEAALRGAWAAERRGELEPVCRALPAWLRSSPGSAARGGSLQHPSSFPCPHQREAQMELRGGS